MGAVLLYVGHGLGLRLVALIHLPTVIVLGIKITLMGRGRLMQWMKTIRLEFV